MLDSVKFFSLAYLVWALLFLQIEADDCNPGFLSTGWILPKADLYVKEGDTVEMYCILNVTNPDAVGGDWRNLSFTIDNKFASEPWIVEKFNETAIKLRWDRAEVSPGGHYSVQCLQNKKAGICTRFVYVGYPPLPVTDFQCTSYNWERLECVWVEPYNPITTSYALSYQILMNSRRMTPLTTPCPGYKSPSRTFVISKASPDKPSDGQCQWTDSSNPQYLPSTKAFNFTMSMVNDLEPGTRWTQPLGVVDNYAIVIPKTMEKLRLVEAFPYSVVIAWNVPFNLAIFPPGLEFRVTYWILSPWADISHPYNVLDASNLVWNKANTTYQLNLSLPYAHSPYNVSVSARSTTANRTDDRFWSIPASIIVRTTADKPCSAPEALLGSFQVNAGLDSRSVTVRWSQLPAECENGPNPGYNIVMLDTQDNFLSSKNLSESTTTEMTFDNLSREQAYRFLLSSHNAVGYSNNSSEVFLPAAITMPSAPENVMRIGYSQTEFEIQWSSSTPSRQLNMATFSRADRLDYATDLSHYTVFWCQSTRDNPITCQGPLYTQEVSPNVTSLNVTVPDSENYQFAVEAHQGKYYGSGMVWSSCIVTANGNGSQIKQVEVVSASTHSLDVAWALSCSIQGGIITGFFIDYCSVSTQNDVIIFENEEPGCFGSKIQVKVGPNVNKYSIDQLNAFTVYKIVVSVETRMGVGQGSTPKINRTLEGKPSEPLDLRQIDVTNRSLSIAWRAPTEPNCASPYYQLLNNGINSAQKIFNTEFTLSDLESFTDYNLSIQACNSVGLCSNWSKPIIIKTEIGVPNAPWQPTLKTKPDNSSSIEIKWQMPTKPAGPLHYSLISIWKDNQIRDKTTNRIDGNVTEFLIDMDQICEPGSELKVAVRVVNLAANGDLLMSPWSDEGIYQCKTEGLSMAQILGISFGAACLVLIVLVISFIGRRVQTQKRSAKKVEVKMPWETPLGGAGNRSEMSSHSKQTPGFMKDFNSGGINAVGNYYGQLKPTNPSKPGSDHPVETPNVADMKKQQSGFPRDVKMDLDHTLDCQSHSSGHSSGQDSLSWHHPNSEVSNDSGAELEPSSPVNDVFSDPTSGSFSKPLARSTSNVADVETINDSEFDQYSAIPLREGQRNGNSVPNLVQHQPYVQVGMLPSVALAPSQSIGYVTLGPSEMNTSPSASPNLSVGSNDSLIAKADRPVMKIVPLKRNSGYVEACCIVPEPVCDLRASPTTGYVSFKSQETVNDGNGTNNAIAIPTTSPPTMATTGGYVTLGSNSAGASPNAPTSTHYVQMGPLPNHTLSYV